MQSFKIVAFLLLGYFWLKLKFTSKCITVGGQGEVLEIFSRFQSYSFGYYGPHAKFQNRSCSPSGLFLVKSEVHP